MQVVDGKIRVGIESATNTQLFLSNQITGVSEMTEKIIPSSPKSIKICSVANCTEKARAKGMCKYHYHNALYYGNPIARRDRSVEEVINEIGWTVTPTGCWEWNGPRNEHGYGRISLRRAGLDHARAHRVIYEIVHKIKLEPNQEIMHSCDNPPCVNPAHLSIGTHAENMADIYKKGRHWFQKRTHCPNGHNLKIEGAVVEVNKAGKTGKLCVLCRRERATRYNRNHHSKVMENQRIRRARQKLVRSKSGLGEI